MGKLRLIIFDWDDVFALGASDAYVACYAQALRDVGVDLAEDEVTRVVAEMWGQPFEDVVGTLVNGDKDLTARAAVAYDKRLFDGTFTSFLSVPDGADRLVDELSEEYTLGIATGSHPQLLKDVVMPQLGIPNRFSHLMSVYHVEDPTLAKPNPHMALEIMAQAKVGPDETILVGDSAGDVGMARGASIEPVVVLTGRLTEAAARELGVRHVIPAVTGLRDVLEKLETSACG